MEIKYLFDDLKKLGNKKYFCRNGEEEIYFSGNDLEIEIFKADVFGDKIDVVINRNGSRDNFRNSPSLSEHCKKDIETMLNSHFSTQVKCKNVARLLIEEFKK